MRILVIGGSSFLGRHIVQTALQREHDVTLFNRGQTNPGLFPEAEHIEGDRNVDLSGLSDRQWDATVDVCGYVPHHVETLLGELGAQRQGALTGLLKAVSERRGAAISAGISAAVSARVGDRWAAHLLIVSVRDYVTEKYGPFADKN